MIELAWAHAIEAYPRESVGIVWGDGERYERLENVATDAEAGVLVGADDLRRIATRPEPRIVVHSHPDGPQCPSAADMRTQAQWGVPFVVLPIDRNGPMGQAFAWGFGETWPYEGRPFRHGIRDCYSLVRDWYGREKGVQLPDCPRDWEWWSQKPPLDLYRENFAGVGFEQIPLEAATQRGDLIFYAIRSPVPQHAAIVLDAQLILHHPAGLTAFDPTRLSVTDLRSVWQRLATMAVRYTAPVSKPDTP